MQEGMYSRIKDESRCQNETRFACTAVHAAAENAALAQSSPRRACMCVWLQHVRVLAPWLLRSAQLWYGLGGAWARR